MSEDFYPFVDSGDPAPDNRHLQGTDTSPESAPAAQAKQGEEAGQAVRYATRIAVYDDMLSTPRVIVIEPNDVRAYLEEITNTVYRCMKEQGGGISLMVIREIVENFIHAHFVEPIISVLDGGNTIRFADQGPGIEDKERAFEFGVTSADREQKRYIRGTGAGFPMVQQYLENAGGAISIEDNLNQGTVVTVSTDQARVSEIERSAARGAAVRGARHEQREEGPMPLGIARNDATSGPGAHATPNGAVGVQQVPGQMPGQQPYPLAGYPQQLGTQAPQYPQPGYPYAPYPQPRMPAYQQGMTYPQVPQQLSTYTGYYGSPAPAGAPVVGVGTGQMVQPTISDRGKLALLYLGTHESCGPTDLSAALGSSTATWSRELEALSAGGFVIKRGQKRVLTEMGRLWVSNNAGA